MSCLCVTSSSITNMQFNLCWKRHSIAHNCWINKERICCILYMLQQKKVCSYAMLWGSMSICTASSIYVCRRYANLLPRYSAGVLKALRLVFVAVFGAMNGLLAPSMSVPFLENPFLIKFVCKFERLETIISLSSGYTLAVIMYIYIYIYIYINTLCTLVCSFFILPFLFPFLKQTRQAKYTV